MNGKEKNRLRKELREYAENYTLGFCGQRDENAIYLFMSGVEATFDAIDNNLHC